MRALYMSALLMSLAVYASAIETELTVDTAQPRAILTQFEFDLGGTYDLRVFIRENSRIFRGLETNDVVVFQFTTNVTAGTWCVNSNIANNVTSGTSLIRIGPLRTTGFLSYEVYLMHAATKYPLGGGYLNIINTTGNGDIVEDDYYRPLDTDRITMTGSNVFARLSDVPATPGMTNVVRVLEFEPGHFRLFTD